MRQEDTGIFQNYEIKNWNYSPRFYKILGAAAVFNLLTLFVTAQADIFTTRGCDSPMVSRVCQVLDTVYLGSVLLGRDSEFVSQEYVKTRLEDADITYIDVSGVTPPLKYPEGYFALANPESQFTAMNNPTDFSANPSGIPGIPGFPTTNPTTNKMDLTAIPQVTPTPNKKVVTGPIPTSPFVFDDVNPVGPNPVPKPRVAKNRPPIQQRPIKSNKSNLEDKLNAQNQDKKDDKPSEPKVPEVTNSLIDDGKPNKKPLEDFGTKYGPQILNKEINVNAPFTIEITAELDENGKFIKPKVVTKEGSDEKMSEVAKEAIAAFSDTKLLKPLYDVGGRKINITFSQNQDNLQAIIKAETKSDSMAKTIQSGLNLYLKNFFKPKEGSDEAVLMQKAQFATQGKNFIINFLIPNEEKTQMIEKSLKDLQEKLKKNQLNNNNSVGENSNNNAK